MKVSPQVDIKQDDQCRYSKNVLETIDHISQAVYTYVYTLRYNIKFIVRTS